MRCRRPLILASIVAIAGFSLLAAACGGSRTGGVAGLKTTTTANAGTSGSPPSGGSLAQYATCMRSHGISTFPPAASLATLAGIKAAKGQINQISQSEAPSPKLQAAQRTCAKYAPPSQSPAHVSPQEMQKLLAVSHCMRTHGVPNFPDPNPTTGELTASASIDKNSPQVLAALRACSSLGQAAGLGAPSTGP
jgi:hypothetical protein